MNILFTSVGRRTYLISYFKEALGTEGEVHVMNSEESPAFFVADKAKISPLIYDAAYLPFVKAYCKAEKIDLLISLFDIDLPILATHREEFNEQGTTVLVADPAVVEICNDKWKTYEFLMSNHIPTPATYLELEQVKRALKAGEIHYPVMIKPRWGMGSLAIYEADDELELDVFYRKVCKKIQDSYLRFEAGKDMNHCVLIQEKLFGTEYGLDVMNDLEGNYWATSAKHKYAMRSGETDHAEIVAIPQLQEIGGKIAGLLRHRGNLDLDVFDAKGSYYVLEMNARFGGGYPFSHMAGVNLPRAIVDWKRGRTVKPELLLPKTGVSSYKDIRMVQGTVSCEKTNFSP